ncbi:uncharacterized protein B0T23DRAFT_443521 [Neurospora hispaniola]|uniref:DEAD-box RNA helicase Q domain-containing protein n=1 Tax=Neurospora hispaniola TaxID=588809 RepID=A0AAJ0I5F4_9PEZI|nr:hypothetical protein B0T23DRAFT_443521 [Neurospora hispaniola]
MMGHFSVQKTHRATSRSLWVLSPCVLTRGIILLNKYSPSSSAIRPLLAQRSMEQDLDQGTRELIDSKALVAATKGVRRLGLAPIRQRATDCPERTCKNCTWFSQLTTLGGPEGSNRVEPIESFRTADLHPAILRNAEIAGYDMPTPIQRYYIPATVLWQESVRGLR